MPAKRSTRFTVKQVARRLKRQFASGIFARTQFTVERPMAIGIIVVSIVGTAMLIVASSEPTSAASAVADQPTVAVAPVQETPIAKAQKRSGTAEQAASVETAGATAGSDLATVEGCLVQEEDQFR